jgi:hypothetical protein
LKSGKLSQELDFVSHNVRTKLDELKRQEVSRLRMLLKAKMDAKQEPSERGWLGVPGWGLAFFSFWHTFSFLFILFYFLVFQDRVSLCSPGCPGTHSVDQAGLCLPSAGIKGVRHCCSALAHFHIDIILSASPAFLFIGGGVVESLPF